MWEAWRLFASSLLVFFEHGVHRGHGEKHGEIISLYAMLKMYFFFPPLEKKR